MELNELLNEITRKLQGHVAVVQIFVDGEVHVRRVGDANRLIDNPSLIPPSSTLSFLEWMRQQIEDANVTNGTKSNHRNCLRHLLMFREDITFADLDYRLVCAFDRHLRAMKLKINTIAKLMKVWHRYINIAISEDLLIADPFRKYTIRRESTRKDTPPTIMNSTFYESRNLSAFYVPATSVEAYKTAQYWSSYAGIIQAIQE